MTPHDRRPALRSGGSRGASENAALLIQKMAYHRDIIEMAPLGYMVLTRNGAVRYCNQSLAVLLRTSKSHLIGNAIYPHVAREDRDTLFGHLRTLFKSNRNSAACELTLLTAKGEPILARLDSIHDVHPDGRPECRTLITDITELRRKENELEAALQTNARHLAQMSALFRQMTEGIFLLDPEGRLTDLNNAALKLWGYPNASPLLQPYRKLIDKFEIFDLEGEPLPKPRWPFRRVLDGEVLEDYEVRVRCSETGRSFIGSYHGTPVRGTDGRTILFIITVRDVTDQYEARNRIRESRNALRRMNETLEARVAERTAEVRRMADRLRALAMEMSRVEQRERSRLAGVLHDHLQQMLAAIRFQLTASGRLQDAEKIHTITDRCQNMLTEAIDMARDLSRELSPPVLKESGLTEGLKWLAGRMAEQQGFRVEIRNRGPVEPIPEEVRHFLFESVRELLFNIIKHAGVRKAEVRLFRPDRKVEIQVIDRGRGFDPAALEDRDAQGISFGLFSIRERLAYLGGAMAIESEPDKGCRVTLTVPLGEPEAPEAPAEVPAFAPATDTGTAEPGDGSIRILLADDHTLVRQGLAGMLAAAGFLVAGEAADGRQAVEMADLLHPDLVLMDVNMPELNGIEATRIIRERHPHMPVIGLSMHVDEAVAQTMRNAGAADYLTKDGPAEVLVETILKTVGRPPEETGR